MPIARVPHYIQQRQRKKQEIRLPGRWGFDVVCLTSSDRENRQTCLPDSPRHSEFRSQACHMLQKALEGWNEGFRGDRVGPILLACHLVDQNLFPYSAILQTFCIYAVFLAYYLYLTKFADKPISQSNKENTGILIMFFLNLSILVWISVIIILLVLKFNHGDFDNDGEVRLCGPFADNTN